MRVRTSAWWTTRDHGGGDGLVAAGVAELAAVVSVLGLFRGPPDWQPTGSTVTVLTPWITLSTLGVLVNRLDDANQHGYPDELVHAPDAGQLGVDEASLDLVGVNPNRPFGPPRVSSVRRP